MSEHQRHRSPEPATVRAIIARVRARWRAKLAVRGLTRTAVIAVVAFGLAAVGLEWARFSPAAIITARAALAVVLVAAAAWFVVRPLRRRVTDEQVALYLEEHDPSLEARLLSAIEADRPGVTPESTALLERLIEQAIERCAAADALRLENRPLRGWAAILAGVSAATVIAVLVGPAFLRNAVSALLLVSRDVEAAAPYRLDVEPGNASIAKGADTPIHVRLVGFTSDDVRVHARRGSATAFEHVAGVPTDDGRYEALLFNVDVPVEYYAEAEGVRSATYTLRVVELPYVDRLDIEYRYPAYTGLEPETVEDGGDVAAPRGTEVRVRITPTMKTGGGQLLLNDKTAVPLATQPDGTLTGAFTVDGDGFYRVELEAGAKQRVSASPQYTIDVLTDGAPTVSFRRPGRDTSASPIEEVFVEANAADDYGIRKLELVYSVNGGPEKAIPLFNGSKRMPEVTAGHTFYLEEFGVQPGDSVSYYARATDNDASGGQQRSSDLYFLRVRPFSKDFRQAPSQAGGGGGGGGGGAGGQVEALSEQQRQIISATFNIERDRKTLGRDKLREGSTVVSLSQARLREQVEGLLTRMNSQLVERDPAFEKIGALLPQAVTAMKEAEGKLAAASPDTALPPENKALQILQKAEEEYQLQVSVNQQQGGGGGGGGGGAMQQELADIFEQELDKMASRYETASQASQQAGDRQVDALLEKLKELARRQQQQAERARQMARQGQSGGGSSAAQQRALADQVEEAARRLERLAREEQRQDLAESARQMKEAADQMRRAASGGSGGEAQAQAALERLRETERQLQQGRTARAGRGIDEARAQADAVARAQAEIARESARLPSQVGPRTPQHRQLVERKSGLEQRLGDLEQQLDRAARDASQDEKAASRKLADAAEALRGNEVRDKVRFTRELANRGAPSSMMTAAEGEITRGIDEMRRKLDEAAAALGQGNPGDRRDQAVERAQRLARGLESLRERTRERATDGSGQQGEQGRDGRQQASNNESGQRGQAGQQGQQGQQGQRGQDGRGQQAGQRGQQGQSGQQGQGQSGQPGQQQGQQAGQGQQGQGQQGQGQQGQGQQGQGGGQGRGQQQAANGQQGGGQGGGGQAGGGQRGDNRGDRVGLGYGSGGPLNGYEALNGGNAFDGRGWQLSPEDIRQLQGEARQYAGDARDLRGMLRGENLDPKQLDEILKALQRLQDERVYQDAAELQRLQAFVSEGLKRVAFGLRQQVEGESAATRAGSDDVPDQFKSLVEQYYRSLGRTVR